MPARRVLQREIERLKESFLLYGGKVELAISQAVKALDNLDVELAQEVIRGDQEIDQLEVDLEEDCLKLLALYQPVAVDLRFIVAVLKINNDLERIGDNAASIADHAISLSKLPPIPKPFDYDTMVGRTCWMLRTSLDALVNMSSSLANSVRDEDDKIDAINRDMYLRVEAEIKQNPEQAEALLHMIGLSRSLERVADLATNIAEEVVYLVEGVIVRHRSVHPLNS